MAVKSIKKIKEPQEKALKREQILKELEKQDGLVGSHSLDSYDDPIDRIKWSVCREILIAKRLLGLSSKEASEVIGLDKSRTSEIMHYKFDKFTIDRLLTCFLKFRNKHPQIEKKAKEILLTFSKTNIAS